MAQITFFHYIHKNTILHAMDGRLKILCMLILSISVGFAKTPPHYALLYATAITGLIVSKLPLSALLRDMKFFIVMMIFVFVADSLFIPGDPMPYFPHGYISIQGIVAGLCFALRLILIITFCTIMTGSTSVLTFRNSIEWYLRPVPFIPEARVATMINLIFILIPVILDNYNDTMNALKSRCIDAGKNPVRKIIFIVFPLLNRMFGRADEIICAIESRLYSETRTHTVFTVHKADFFITALCAVTLIFVVI